MRHSSSKHLIHGNRDWTARLSVLTSALLLMLACWTTPSAASEPEADAPPAPAERKFYGGQLILADGIADSVLATGAMFAVFCALSGLSLSESGGSSGDNATCGVATGFLVAGTGTFLLAPPLVHLGHDRLGAAFGSLGLRASVLGGGVLVEQTIAEDGALLVAGHVVATRLIDWFVLAYEKPKSASKKSFEVTLRPTLSLDIRNPEIGFRGQF